jgi:hypothetical protein
VQGAGFGGAQVSHDWTAEGHLTRENRKKKTICVEKHASPRPGIGVSGAMYESDNQNNSLTRCVK